MNIALIIAGGSGQRMGQDIPKQFINVYDKPIIVYTMEAFQRHPEIDAIWVVCLEGWRDVVKAYARQFGITKLENIVPGGERGQDSIRNGLKDIATRHLGAEDIVLIHDGARPYIKPEVIDEMTAVCESCGAVIAGMPVKDTIKIADPEGFVASTTDRALTWQIQTPQCFVYSQIMEAYEKILPFADRMMITDDAMVYEAAFPDKKIKLYKAGYENIKITTPDDLR